MQADRQRTAKLRASERGREGGVYTVHTERVVSSSNLGAYKAGITHARRTGQTFRSYAGQYVQAVYVYTYVHDVTALSLRQLAPIT